VVAIIERVIASYQMDEVQFNVPKKNNNRINIEDLDSIVLYEDGIGDMVIPFLTDFNESGLDSLLMCCLTWLGEYFFRDDSQCGP